MVLSENSNGILKSNGVGKMSTPHHSVSPFTVSNVRFSQKNVYHFSPTVPIFETKVFRFWTKVLSITSISYPNLFTILPIGVVSKIPTDQCSTRDSKLLWISIDAFMAPRNAARPKNKLAKAVKNSKIIHKYDVF